MRDQAIVKRWSINWNLVLTAALSAGGAAWTVNVSYFGLVARVTAVEAKNVEQDQHMTRIERAQADLKNDTAQQLRDIGGDVKEIRSILLNNAAGQRPEINRWSLR